MTKFKELAYEIAFGDNAINKGYTDEEVIKQIREFSDLALQVKNLQNLFDAIFENTDDKGKIKLQYIADELEELGYFNT